MTCTTVAGLPSSNEEPGACRQKRERRTRRRGGPRIERLWHRLRERAAAERPAAVAAVSGCGVDGEIDAAVSGGGFLQDAPDISLVGDIALQRERSGCRDAVERLLRARDTGNAPALRQEQLDHGAAEIPRPEDDRAPRAHSRNTTPFRPGLSPFPGATASIGA